MRKKEDSAYSNDTYSGNLEVFGQKIFFRNTQTGKKMFIQIAIKALFQSEIDPLHRIIKYYRRPSSAKITLPRAFTLINLSSIKTLYFFLFFLFHFFAIAMSQGSAKI